MILTPLPLDNPWKRSAIAFFIFGVMSGLVAWTAFGIKVSNFALLKNYLLCVMTMSFCLFFVGTFFSVTKRLKYFVLILGFFCMLPLLIFSIAPAFFYLFYKNLPSSISLSVSGLYFIISILWICGNVKNTAKIEKEFSYLDSQISRFGNVGYVDRIEVLDFPVREGDSKKEKNISKAAVISLAFVGYPLQRFLSAAIGDAAVLLFLAILCTPLSIYFMGKIASGFYLWIYAVSRYERINNVKVIMVNPSP